MINRQDNDIENQIIKQGKTYSKTKSEAALSRYFNKIEFRYIPAIKDNSCFNILLTDLYDALLRNNKKSMDNFQDTLNDLDLELSKLSQNLADEFQKVTGIKSNIKISTSVNELTNSLSVSTYIDGNSNNSIPLFNRGDGIRM